jgi:hypothetical protein
MSAADEVGRQRWRREKRQAALSLRCPAVSCAAPKGQPCRKRNGDVAPYFHAGRLDAGMRKLGRLAG